MLPQARSLLLVNGGEDSLAAACVWVFAAGSWQPLQPQPWAAAIEPGRSLQIPHAQLPDAGDVRGLLVQAWDAWGRLAWQWTPGSPNADVPAAGSRLRVERDGEALRLIAPGDAPAQAAPPQVWSISAGQPQRFDPDRPSRCPQGPRALPVREQGPGRWQLDPAQPPRSLWILRADGTVQVVDVRPAQADEAAAAPRGWPGWGPTPWGLGALACLGLAAWRAWRWRRNGQDALP